MLKFWNNLKLRFISILISLLLLTIILISTHAPYFYVMYGFLSKTNISFFKNAPNTQKQIRKPFIYSNKQIVYYNPDSLKRTTGAYIQLGKNDLARNQSKLIPYLLPKGYMPYKFASYNFKPFYLYSKQTLFNYPLISNPNYKNNVYTIPTNIAQGGLFAKNAYHKRDTYQFAAITGDSCDSNYYDERGWGDFTQRTLNGNTLNDQLPKRLNQGKNKLLISYLGYCGRLRQEINLFKDVQDSPNYIQNQLVQKLRQLPKGYHLALQIKLHYLRNYKIPISITYQWSYLNKNKYNQTVKHNYKLPILHSKIQKKIGKCKINVLFPNYSLDDHPFSKLSRYDDYSFYEMNKKIPNLYNGYLDASILNNGYELINEPRYGMFCDDEDFQTGAIDPIDIDYVTFFISDTPPTNRLTGTPLINCFKDHKLMYFSVILVSWLICEIIFTIIWLIWKHYKNS